MRRVEVGVEAEAGAGGKTAPNEPSNQRKQQKSERRSKLVLERVTNACLDHHKREKFKAKYRALPKSTSCLSLSL